MFRISVCRRSFELAVTEGLGWSSFASWSVGYMGGGLMDDVLVLFLGS